MTSCDLDRSVPDWIIEYPKTLEVFGSGESTIRVAGIRWHLRVGGKVWMPHVVGSALALAIR